MLAFQPDGPILAFSADATPPTSVQAQPKGVQSGQVMLTNTSTTVDVVVGWGQTDTLAKANAVVGASINQCFLRASTQLVVTATGPYFTGIAASSVGVKVQTGTAN